MEPSLLAVLPENVVLFEHTYSRSTDSVDSLARWLYHLETGQIEKWFHTLKQRIDRFYTSWVGSRPSVQQWLEQFVHYYNHQRPHQSLDNRTPVEEELN